MSDEGLVEEAQTISDSIHHFEEVAPEIARLMKLLEMESPRWAVEQVNVGSRAPE